MHFTGEFWQKRYSSKLVHTLPRKKSYNRQVIASLQSGGTLILVFLLEFTCAMQKMLYQLRGHTETVQNGLHIEAVRNTPHIRIHHSKAKYGSFEWGHMDTV